MNCRECCFANCFRQGCDIELECTDYRPITPKEKPMEKIQMTEEEAREIIRTLVETDTIKNIFNEDAIKKSEDACIEKLNNKGYIRKSAVEEAEELYTELKLSTYNFTVLEEKQHKVIHELKAENERLKVLVDKRTGE